MIIVAPGACRVLVIRWPEGTPPPADGCRRCGHRAVTHDLILLHQRARPHSFEPPTPAQWRARAAALLRRQR
ncbi:hypothetical protein ACFQYP_50975 [Nonomuraea antimicrobica]